jgi:hypothetical protein
LEDVRWEKYAYPGIHSEGPQGLIDLLLDIENCDILIGIFWKRLGTPIKKDGKTGTEHEIMKAYELWKQNQNNKKPPIMIYFKRK